MRNQFSVFKGLEKKTTKALMPEKNVYGELAECTYFHPEIFKTIYDMAEYKYLKDGLYVHQDVVTIDDIFGAENFSKSELGKKLSPVSWHDAKNHALDKGGKLLTLPEYKLIWDHMNITRDDSIIWEREWLDGIIFDWTIATHTKIKDDKLWYGPRYKIPRADFRSSFTPSQLSDVSGFPGYNGTGFSSREIHFKIQQPNWSALYLTKKIDHEGKQVPLIENASLDDLKKGLSFRVCYAADKLKKKSK